MRYFAWIAFGAILVRTPTFARTIGVDAAAAYVSGPADNPASSGPTTTDNNTGSETSADDNQAAANKVGNTSPSSASSPAAVPQEYVPMTASERARKYIIGAFGPGAILRAAAGASISQWNETPKEWGVGAEAYGERFGNALAKHVIREALEFGGSAALREDNRYFRSTESGFLKRSKHAMVSIFEARNEAGGVHFAYSRFGAVLGSSFISRIWQPRSTDSAGDAAESFGITMAADIGINFFHEFCPRSLTRRFEIH